MLAVGVLGLERAPYIWRNKPRSFDTTHSVRRGVRYRFRTRVVLVKAALSKVVLSEQTGGRTLTARVDRRTSLVVEVTYGI